VAHLLGAESLRLVFPTKTIFESVTLGVADGDRIGIVGRNGDGKSTLLRLLSGRQTPDGGKVTMQRGLDIGYLDQADVLDESMTIGKAVVGDTAEHEWAGNSRVRDIIDGLVNDMAWDATVKSLSGGQRRRVALAAVLAKDHDIVMLDEPTNHLDVEAITWLAEHMKKRWTRNEGGFMVVTHDRWFLDEVCTTTWEVHDGVVDPFEGGYAAYILQRVERDRMAAVTERKRQNLMRKELAWLRRGPPARTSKPKFRIDAANALIADEPPVREAVQLQQMAVQRLGKDVVDLQDICVAYDDNVVLRNVNWNIAPGERAGILGVNGAGKSTLLRVITGEQAPTSGKMKRGKNIKIETLTQQAMEGHSRELVRELLDRKRRSFTVGGKEVSSSQLLEQLGFTSPQLKAPINELSGGQKRRLQLLLILLDEPNVLIMDEPSNDLDTDMLAAMEDLLDGWPGTLIVVSHDRYLMERVTDVQYAIVDGHFRHLPGGIDEYVALQRRRGGSGESAARHASTTKGPRVSTGMSNADRQAAMKEFTSTERKLEKIPSQLLALEERIQQHDQSDYDGLTVMAEQVLALKQKAAELENRWLELSELLE
jgi:ABC transport system ATP-binding/permease protein